MIDNIISSSEIIAAIDVGTNSFHIIIASVNEKGILRIHSRDKEMVRLGSGAKDMKLLTEDSIQRGISTLQRFQIMANKANASIRAIGTSALREAENRDLFVSRVEKLTGIHVNVISGTEEGRLIYIGALHALPILKQRALVIDIGGGSTETTIGLLGDLEYVHSSKLGSIRLSQRFFPNGYVDHTTVQACRNHIKGELAPILTSINAKSFDTVIGCSGTIQTLVQMVFASKDRKLPETFNGITVQTDDIISQIQLLVNSPNTKDRAILPGMESKRADIIVAGALILEHIITSLSISKIVISAYALREGIVFDTIQKDREIREYHHLTRLRYETVNNLCDIYRVNIDHANHVKDIALQIFDDTFHRHSLGDIERELLEAAALLHDVGYHISPERHHHHSQYIISHCVMPGFTNDEAEIIGMIARYHRKSHPKKKHLDFFQCSEENQHTIKVLAGILRIAEGLDRRQQQIVNSVHCDIHDVSLDIHLYPKQGLLPDIEIWGAERRKQLLEETLGVSISFTV